MPLPTGGATPWPPPSSGVLTDRLNLWSAWYTGDPTQLERLHGGSQATIGPAAPPGWHQENATYSSSLPGASSGAPYRRTFWGSQVPAGEQRMKLHVPLASDIAAMSADLLFAEPPTLTGANDVTTERLEHYEQRGLWTSLREAAEIAAALGGVYLRVVWDVDMADHPWLEPAHPDVAVPEWSWGYLRAVTFFNVITPSAAVGVEYLGKITDKVVRHLERHESGAILHGVYVGTVEALGQRVPLASFPETEAFAGPGEDGVIPTGTPLLTAEYIPNIKPNRIWRGIPSAVNFGRSDYSGVEPVMDALDETWTSWMRDVRLAKARLVVEQSALESLGKGQGAFFDSEREIYAGLSMGADGSAPLTLVQFDIRSEKHLATTNALVDQIVRGCGYSPSTLSGSDDVAITATEVEARERRTLITRGRKVEYWKAGLERVATALVAVDNAQFGAGLDENQPTVDFPENVFVTLGEVASTLQLLADAGAVSTRTKVSLVHPKWDEEQIEEEIEAIQGEALAPLTVGLDQQQGENDSTATPVDDSKPEK